jgi:hypothetical protein
MKRAMWSNTFFHELFIYMRSPWGEGRGATMASRKKPEKPSISAVDRPGHPRRLHGRLTARAGANTHRAALLRVKVGTILMQPSQRGFGSALLRDLGT